VTRAVVLWAAVAIAAGWCVYAWSVYADGLGHQYNAYAIAGPAPQRLSPEEIARLTHLAKYETRLGAPDVEPLEWEKRWSGWTGGLLPPLYARPLTQEACEYEVVRNHDGTPLVLRKTCRMGISRPGLLAFMLLPAALILAAGGVAAAFARRRA
jgi:hypothetical protein